MKYIIAAAICFVLLASMGWAGETFELEDVNDKANYSVGYQIGGDFKRQGVALNPEAMVKGIQDGLSGTEPLLTEKEMRTALIELKKRITATQKEMQERTAQANLVKGRAFLADNKQKEGVETLPSGLQYKILQKGSGLSPGPEDTVTVHYRGTLIDGSEFDSSYSRKEPATFRAGRAIKGWQEALPMMKEGAKWQLFVPPDLAYGESGAGSRIGPNSTLVFEMELLSVLSAATGEEAEPNEGLPASQVEAFGAVPAQNMNETPEPRGQGTSLPEGRS